MASAIALTSCSFDLSVHGVRVASEHDDDLAILLLLRQHEGGVVVLISELLVGAALEQIQRAAQSCSGRARVLGPVPVGTSRVPHCAATAAGLALRGARWQPS